LLDPATLRMYNVRAGSQALNSPIFRRLSTRQTSLLSS
jgi:hypothetical protein